MFGLKKKEKKKEFRLGYKCPGCGRIVPERCFCGTSIIYLKSFHGFIHTHTTSVCEDCGEKVTKKWKEEVYEEL